MSRSSTNSRVYDYWRHAIRGPLTLSLIVALIIAMTDIDLDLARWIFFDAAQMHWRGADSWWTNEFIHSGGGWVVRGISIATGAVWALSFVRDTLQPWRRPAGYFLLSTLLSVGIVGLLKHYTNVDCPWDLAPYGGHFPYVHLFADRPDALRAAHCFPAAHAGSGYSLMALYFVGREHGRRWACGGVFLGIASGLVFGIAQQSRGAHFLSHDLCSATISWCVSLTLYCAAFRCRL